jgi:hypothetical protein
MARYTRDREKAQEVAVVVRRCVHVVLSILVVAGCGPSSEHEEDDLIVPTLPIEVAEWTADGDAEVYDTESIYGYIDGHAEVYLAYGMKRCLSRRYLRSEVDGEIVVDLFEMASSADAFGVFSHDRDGEEVAMGQGGVFRHGWLSFWTGSWYGSVYSSGDGEAARDAVLVVGRAVAEGLPGGGEVPAIVDLLPTGGLDESSVCFLRSPQILNAHVWVGNDNVFGIGPDVEAVVGKYEEDGMVAHLVVVRYPSETSAEAIEHGARDGADSVTDQTEMVVGRRGSIVAAVVGSDLGSLGEALLTEVLGGDA